MMTGIAMGTVQRLMAAEYSAVCVPVYDSYSIQVWSPVVEPAWHKLSSSPLCFPQADLFSVLTSSLSRALSLTTTKQELDLKQAM